MPTYENCELSTCVVCAYGKMGGYKFVGLKSWWECDTKIGY